MTDELKGTRPNIVVTDGLDEDVCEVCGKPATSWVRDLIKGPDKEYQGWYKHVPDSDPHHFCDLHKREPKITEVPYEI